MKIILTSGELMLAAIMGSTRQVRSITSGKQHRHGADKEKGFAMHITGAIGEMVVSKHLGIYYVGGGDVKAPDLTNGDKVRCTPMSDGCLILHPDDKPHARYWLVTGSVNGTEFHVRGSIIAQDGMLDKYWRDDVREPAYFVPQGALVL